MIINLLGAVQEYLSERMPQYTIVYTQMPDEPQVCICLYEDNTGLQTLIFPQIDAEIHYVRIRIRHTSFDEAYTLAQLTSGFMQTDNEAYPYVSLSEIDTTGIINLTAELSVQSLMVTTPKVVDDAAAIQQGLRMVEFTVRLITKKLN